MATLKIVEGSKPGDPLELGERATLGRSQECDLQIKDVESSRVHSEVFLRDGDYHVRDLKSSNGTLLNGEKIDETVLKHGDRIQIGAVVVEFIDESAKTDIPDLESIALEGEGQQFLCPPGYAVARRTGGNNLTQTYLATDEAMGRQVVIEAINEPYCSDPDAVLAGIKEAARLEHPALVRIYETGQREGSAYFVREPATGKSVWNLCGKLTEDEVVEAAVAVAGALAEAHAASIVHGSLRPDRIIRTDPGHVRLLGLGLPAPETGDLSTEPDLQRRPNRIAYMAAEQFHEPPSPAADVYSLGATLYHMLCGRVPFGAISEADLAPKIATEDIIPIQQLRPGIAEPLAELVGRMLSRSPGDRPQSMIEVQSELEQIRQPEEQADRTASPIEERAAAAREPGGLSASAILIVILTLLLVGAVFLLSRVAGEWFIKMGNMLRPK
jgi:hypothetical protein